MGTTVDPEITIDINENVEKGEESSARGILVATEITIDINENAKKGESSARGILVATNNSRGYFISQGLAYYLQHIWQFYKQLQEMNFGSLLRRGFHISSVIMLIVIAGALPAFLTNCEANTRDFIEGEFSKQITDNTMMYYRTISFFGEILPLLSFALWSDTQGRNPVLRRVYILIFIGGACTLFMSWDTSLFLAFQLVLDTGMQLLGFISLLYLTETSAESLKAFIIPLFSLAYQSTAMVPKILAPKLKKVTSSLYSLYWYICILALLGYLLTLRLPESPWWSQSQAKDQEDEDKIRSAMYDPTMAMEDTDRLTRTASTDINSIHAIPKDGYFMSLLRPFRQDDRGGFLKGMLCGGLQPLSGVIGAMFDGSHVKDKIAYTGGELTIRLPAYAFLIYASGTILCWLLVNRLGRKPLMLVGLVGEMACHISLGLLAHVDASQGSLNWLVFTVLGLSMFFDSLGMGSIAMLVAIELFPVGEHSLCITWTGIAQLCTRGLIYTLYVFLHNHAGLGFTSYTFAAISFLSAVAIYYIVPETRPEI